MKLFYYIIHSSDVISLQPEINMLSSPSPEWFVSTRTAKNESQGLCNGWMFSFPLCLQRNKWFTEQRKLIWKSRILFLLVGFLEARQEPSALPTLNARLQPGARGAAPAACALPTAHSGRQQGTRLARRLRSGHGGRPAPDLCLFPELPSLHGSWGCSRASAAERRALR